MKHFASFSIGLIFLCCTNSSGNDYQLFRSGQIYIYEYEAANKRHFSVFKSDRLTISNADTIFSNYRMGNDDYVYNVPAYKSIYYSDTSWSGYLCIIKPNGMNVLLNRFSDSIFFKTTALLGDTWTFFRLTGNEYFSAEVVSISNDSVFGVTDSVKTITINRYDSNGVLVPDSINNFNFRLSHSFGLLSTLNIKHFPFQKTIYSLKGIDMLVGDQRITPESIFDFDVGDVFHYYSYQHVSASVEKYTYEKRTILSKIVSAKSVSYDIDDSVFTRTLLPPLNIQDAFTHNVITESHSYLISSHDSLCGTLPHAITKHYSVTWHRSINNRRAINYVPCIRLDSTLTSKYLTRSNAVCVGSSCNFPGGVNLFVEGLGLVQLDASLDSASSSMYSCRKNLVYYSKGNEIWGNPVVFPVTVGIADVNANDNSVFFQPNPATNSTLLKNVFNLKSLRLFDCGLKTVNSGWKYLDNQLTLECDNLLSGFYIVELEYADGRVVYLKLSVQH